MNKPKYDFEIQRKYGDNYYCSCSCIFDENGNSKVMHNEIGFNFTYKNKKIVVNDGWHIGTSDFDFSGTNNNSIVDDYNPGLLTRVREFLKKNKLEEDWHTLSDLQHAQYMYDRIYYWLESHKDYKLKSISSYIQKIPEEDMELIHVINNAILEIKTWKNPSNYSESSFRTTFEYYKNLGE